MDLLKRFGKIYTFPGTEISLKDNFKELVTRTRRLPGANGGYDDLGSERSLSEVGSVRADFWLFFNDEADATRKMDEIGKMADAGVQLLYKQPQDTSLQERYCWARLDNLDYQQAAKDQPHKRLKVSLIFQVSDPF